MLQKTDNKIINCYKNQQRSKLQILKISMNLNKHKFISIQKHLKILSVGSDKQAAKNYWFFQSSLYQIHIIDISTPYPHHKISSQNPIQYFGIFHHAELNTINLIIVNSASVWIMYQILVQSKAIKINQVSQSTLQDMDSKVVGIHEIDLSNSMAIFVKEDGKLEYNYLGGSQKQQKTLKLNKLYQVPIPSNKYTKSNLFSRFKGKELLQTKNQNRITGSAYNLGTNQLFVTTEDLNSEVCSILRFFIQDYEIMSGSDFLLNLPSHPLQIEVLGNIPIINLGEKILVWFKNATNDIQVPNDGGYCTSLAKIGKQKLIACFTKSSQFCIYLITFSSNPKENKNIISPKIDKIIQVKNSQTILHYSPADTMKQYPGLGINSKLQIVSFDKDGTMKTCLSNMQAKIQSAVLHKQKHSHFLKITKKVGYSTQEKILTNNRIVTEIDQYQHNLLIKMANISKYNVKGDKSQIYFSSPIIGTLKLALTFVEDKKVKSNKVTSQSNFSIQISMGASQPNLITEEQTLYIDPSNSRQITPSKLLTGKSRFNVADIFEGNTDSVLAGCIVGGYALLSVEKQVHIFTLDPKPKRSHIYVFDAQIKNVMPLNNINLWCALLWDGSLQILRIHQKESIKFNQIENVQLTNSQCHFSFDAVINTAPHVMTIIGSNLIVCSNDPLHVYQPEKTTTKIIKLPQQQIGNQFYPVVDLTQAKGSSDKFILLSNYQSKWMLLNFPTKCLVKNLQQIKIEVQQIVAFPKTEGLMIAIFKDSSLCLICSNKIVNGTMQTGPINYKTSCSILPQQASNTNLATDSLQYLKRWLSKQEVSHSKFAIQSGQDMSETHPLIIKLSENRLLLCGYKQIWYASLQKGVCKLISYFSMSNDAFTQFRNNLGVHELENAEFMEMFIDKLPIISVQKISTSVFAVLYEKLIVIIQIRSNGALAIKQQIPFKDCPGLIAISQFIGAFDQMSLYMRDSSHRLILLQYDHQTKTYKLEIKQDLQDELVCIHRVKGWKDRIRKVDFLGKQTISYEQLLVKKDGQLLVGDQTRPLYI